MPINNKHKLILLTDILKNQDVEKYMTKDECEQISLLTSSLLEETSLEETIYDTIREINNLHTNDNKAFSEKDVNQWLAILEQYRSL